MSKQQHPTHNLVPLQPGAEPSIGVGNSVNQRDHDGHNKGINQHVNDALNALRPIDGGTATLPSK